jgi:hypothetical protein
VIEWHGVNQHGERPEITDEANSCSDFGHIVRLSYHEQYGGTPDAIIDNDGVEYTELLERVVDEMVPGRLQLDLF